MAEANWYVVHTYSGYENKVKTDIEKMVDNRGLNDLVKEVSVPLEDVVEDKENGQKKIVQRKKFPGYVLLKMIMNIMNVLQYMTSKQVKFRFMMPDIVYVVTNLCFYGHF